MKGEQPGPAIGVAPDRLAADGTGAGPARASSKGARAQALGPKESEGDAAAALRRLRDQELRPADGREEEDVMCLL